MLNSISISRIFNLISALLDIIALCICFTFLFIIIYHFIRKRPNRRRETKINVPLILSINTLCIIIIKSTLQIIHVTIPTLTKNFYFTSEVVETFSCQIRGFILWATIGHLYWSYVLLAFFRFVRVIYPKQIWLHRSSLCLYVFIPCQFILEYLAILPILVIFDGIHLLTNEAYCSLLLRPLYLLIYTCTIGFGIPYSIFCIFYVSIVRKIRQISIIRPYQNRNRRDYAIIRRMLLNIVILFVVTIPYFILYIIGIIEDRFNPVLHPLQWLSSSLSSCLFALILPIITTQLLDLLKLNRL